jgi:hypothetical protein
VSSNTVTIHELIAWGLDEYSFRSSGTELSDEEFADKIERAKEAMARRVQYEPADALLNSKFMQIQQFLAVYTKQTDLQKEYEQLDWEMGVVDLRCLLAFQRRLVFDSQMKLPPIPKEDDWASLFSLSFGSARNTGCSLTVNENAGSHSEFILQSSNPDLQLRPLQDVDSSNILPLSLYGGSPFFEVAEFRGRWFLRDGYHRAYRLLLAGIHCVPAVVIRARTMDEVGATQPWFFSEKELFSTHPPRVTDFLDGSLVLRYQRPRLVKTIRICIEESLEPICEEKFQGDTV